MACYLSLRERHLVTDAKWPWHRDHKTTVLFIYFWPVDRPRVLLAVPGLIWRTRKRTTLQMTQTRYQRRGSRGTIWEASASLSMLLVTVTVAWNVLKLKCVFFMIGIAVRCWKQFSRFRKYCPAWAVVLKMFPCVFSTTSWLVWWQSIKTNRLRFDSHARQQLWIDFRKSRSSDGMTWTHNCKCR